MTERTHNEATKSLGGLLGYSLFRNHLWKFVVDAKICPSGRCWISASWYLICLPERMSSYPCSSSNGNITISCLICHFLWNGSCISAMRPQPIVTVSYDEYCHSLFLVAINMKITIVGSRVSGLTALWAPQRSVQIHGSSTISSLGYW